MKLNEDESYFITPKEEILFFYRTIPSILPEVYMLIEVFVNSTEISTDENSLMVYTSELGCAAFNSAQYGTKNTDHGKYNFF